VLDWLRDWLNAFLTWIVDTALWLGLTVYDLVLSGFETVLAAIPVPSFFAGASASLSAIPPSVAYFAQALALGQGLSIVFTAYVLRFVIRRLPVIG